MSGGAYEYVYRRIEDFAESLKQTTALRKAFARLLMAVARAAYDIEWVDSGDYSLGEEDAAIRAALGPNAATLELFEYVEQAKVLMQQLNAAIERAEANK